jgi:polysaccharide export outer membrane protein
MRNNYEEFSMNMSSALPDGVRSLLACLAASILAGCTIVPGNQGYSNRDESEVRLPVQQGDVLAPANIKIKPITAELIIDLFKSARPPTGDGTSSAKVASKNNLRFTGDQPAAVPEYRLGPGDIVSIIVWDHPELTIPAGSFRTAEQAGTVIAEDGTIFFPTSEWSRHRARRPASCARSCRPNSPSSSRGCSSTSAWSLSAASRCMSSAKWPSRGFSKVTDIPMTVLDAVNRAGGFTPEADYSRVLLTRRGTTYLVDIQAMYDYGVREQNVMLEQGDIVNVSDRSYNKIFVLGEVTKPGSLVMNKKRSTLAEALSDAGYINQTTADPRWIYVMRGDTEEPAVVSSGFARAGRDVARRPLPAAAARHRLRRHGAGGSLAARDRQHPADRDDAQSDQPDLLPPVWRTTAVALNLMRAAVRAARRLPGSPPGNRDLLTTPS